MNNQDRTNILETIQGREYPVLDKGFVKLIDVMGSDSSIVQAARVSYGAGTKSVSEDESLIRYLLRNGHTSPFEMCELKFLIRIPMDAWRQWVRHRTASINEYSTRYSLAIEDAYETETDGWRKQSTDNKQGSCGFLTQEEGQNLSDKESAFHKTARELYNERIKLGVAREQARKDLPLCTYTEAYWKIDLHNLFHFLKLRMNPAAQYEIRAYANVIGKKIVAQLFPWSWKAFEDYELNSFRVSVLERQMLSLAIKTLRNGWNIDDFESFESIVGSVEGASKRERRECYEKFLRLVNEE